MNEIKSIKISDLISAPDNPFKVTLDTEMERLIESIAETGVIAPIITRPTENGKYEIVSGHRRKYACEYLGIETVPTIVKDLDRNEAVIFLVDSNLQREHILPSEKAYAYQMKLEAMKRQGKRTDLTCEQFAYKFEGKKSSQLLGEQVGESKDQVRRYIRLTNLIDPILDMVDNKEIALNAAVEISYLGSKEQAEVLKTIESEDTAPSIEQAKKIRRFYDEGKLNPDVILSIMQEQKSETLKVTLTDAKLKKFFPKHYSKQQVEDTIIKLLENWYRKRQQEKER